MAKEILKDEILKDEELDNVAGGTVSETNDLRRTIGEVRLVHGYYNNEPKDFYTYLSIGEVAPYLKEHYGIDATINLGEYYLAGHDYITEGAPNKYSRDGQSLTHQQVLDIIKGK